MTDTIQPFYRANHPSNRRAAPSWWTLRLMRFHFCLAGMVILLGALVLSGLVYADLSKVELSQGLRITNPGDIYEQGTQVKLALAAMLALLSLIPFRAVQSLSPRGHGGPGWARLTGLMLLVGFPASFFVWRMVANLPEARGDMTTVQQVIDDVSSGVLMVAALLFLQSVLALWYQVWLLRPAIRRALAEEAGPTQALRHRLRVVAIGLWLLTLIGLGVALGVLTDWLYEFPVPRPEPGAWLYATSFDAFNDEWDLYPGRDAVQIVNAGDLALAGPGYSDGPLSGGTLLIKYGSGVSDQVIWSALDRKFSDLDLRVTTQLVSGPVDQNQYGVIFRYRDAENFYIFRISGDGYYSLARVVDGFQEKVSDWGQTEAIRQGNTPNEIRVVARGDEFRFFINGQPVPLCLKGQNRFSMWQAAGVCVAGGDLTPVYRDGTFKQGGIALAAGTIDGSDIEVVFDDLVVVGPAKEE